MNIGITHYNGAEVQIPVFATKPAQNASSELTSASLSLPVQDYLRRFGKRAVRRSGGVFAEEEQYQAWLKEHDLAEEMERLFENE